MSRSTRLSYLFLRLGLAAVFFWFGGDKFFHPTYWLNAWIPDWVVALGGYIGIDSIPLVYLNGVFDVLIGLSLVTGVFIRFFSFLGAVILLGIFVFIGPSEITIRDIGLIGGLVAIFLWPERDY